MTKESQSNKKIKIRDECQTPWYAVDPLLRVLKKFGINPQKEKITVVEPFAGEGLLKSKLSMEGFHVLATDIKTGVDFFDLSKKLKKSKNKNFVTISNPPFGEKYRIIKELYDIGNPFALLLPLKTLGAAKAQNMFKKHGVIIILLDKRVNYKMPFLGWESTSDFPSLWILWLGKKQSNHTHIFYETIDQKGVRGDEMYYIKPTPEEIEKYRNERKNKI